MDWRLFVLSTTYTNTHTHQMDDDQSHSFALLVIYAIHFAPDMCVCVWMPELRRTLDQKARNYLFDRYNIRINWIWIRIFILRLNFMTAICHTHTHSSIAAKRSDNLSLNYYYLFIETFYCEHSNSIRCRSFHFNIFPQFFVQFRSKWCTHIFLSI